MYKYKLKIGIVLFMSILMFFSCDLNHSSDIEAKYSCDENIDTWVKINRQKIRRMDAVDFQSYDNAHKRAIFAAMLPEQRTMLWKKHLSDILELDWNIAEKEHLNKLYSYINNNEDLFLNNLKESRKDEIEIFMFRWTDYAKNTLKWSDKTNFYITAKLETIKQNSKTGELFLDSSKQISQHQRIKKKNREENTSRCNCSTENDWCLSQYEVCKDTNCQGVWRGCGFLFLFDCDGECSFDYV